MNLFLIQSLADIRRKLRSTEEGLLGVRTQLYDCVRDGEGSTNQWQNSYAGQPLIVLS